MTQLNNRSQTTPKNRVVALLNQFVEAGSRDWSISPKTMAIICSLPFMVICAGVISGLCGKPAFIAFTGEDGIAECGQVLFYVMAFVLTFFVLRLHIKNGNTFVASLYCVLSCGLFFLIGEELSWGQRIFGWQTPEAMESINKQAETNLHNIYGVGSTFKWMQLVVGAYGALLPLLVLRWSALDGFRPFLNNIVPHFSLVPFFGMMFAWRLFRNLVPTPKSIYFAVAEFNEVIELSLAMGFFFFMIYQLRQLKAVDSAAAEASESVSVAA